MSNAQKSCVEVLMRLDKVVGVTCGLLDQMEVYIESEDSYLRYNIGYICKNHGVSARILVTGPFQTF